MTVSEGSRRAISGHYMINYKINGKVSGEEEITGLNKSGQVSFKFPSLGTCLQNTCSKKGLVQVLRRMWDLSQASGKGNSNGRNNMSTGVI